MPLKYDYAQGREICDFRPAANLLCFKYYTISYIIVTVNQMLSTAPLCHLKIAPYMVEYSVLNRLELRLWFSGCCVISGRPPIALSHLTDHLHCDGGDELDDLFDSLFCKVTSTKFALQVPSPPFLVLSPFLSLDLPPSSPPQSPLCTCANCRGFSNIHLDFHPDRNFKIFLLRNPTFQSGLDCTFYISIKFKLPAAQIAGFERFPIKDNMTSH